MSDRYAETFHHWTRGDGDIVCHVRLEDLPDGEVLRVTVPWSESHPWPVGSPGGAPRVDDWDSQPLGEVPDRVIARRLGVTYGAVQRARVKRGIASWRSRR